MKVGDRVKILAPVRTGDHAYEGHTGTIIRELEHPFPLQPDYKWAWNFEVAVDDETNEGGVAFFTNELEVIV